VQEETQPIITSQKKTKTGLMTPYRITDSETKSSHKILEGFKIAQSATQKKVFVHETNSFDPEVSERHMIISNQLSNSKTAKPTRFKH